MSALIPDPTDPAKPAIYADEKGTRLAPAVHIGPATADGSVPLAADMEDWPVIGYMTSFDAEEDQT